MLLAVSFKKGNSNEQLLWVKGDFGIVSAHYRHDATT
jgi:hypothetical protein